MSLPLQQVGAVEPGGRDPDQNLSGPRIGNRDGNDLEHLRTACIRNRDGAHQVQGTFISRSENGLKSVW